MEIINLKISEIKKYEKNSRTHPREQIEQLKKSIKQFGFNNPLLVDSNKELIAGHGRLEAMAELIKEKEVEDSIPSIILGHLSPEQKRAYVIADNKIAMNSGWDFDLLRSELSDISEFDELESNMFLDSLGFEDYELDSLLGVQGANSKPDNVERGNVDGNYAEGEWNEMPEFNQQDKQSFRHIIVHFKTNEDAADFFSKINHPHTEKTKSIWYPQQVNMDTEAKRY